MDGETKNSTEILKYSPSGNFIKREILFDQVSNAATDTVSIDMEDKLYFVIDGEPGKDHVSVLDSDLNKLKTIDTEKDLRGLVCE